MFKIYLFILSLFPALLFAQSASQETVQPVAREFNIIAELVAMAPMMLIIFFVFYFLVVKPQNKKLEDHRKMLEELKGGSEIMIDSGIHGKVVKVHESEVEVEIANNVKIKVNKDYISKAI